MHTHDLSAWTHEHVFEADSNQSAERRTKLVMWITAAMMMVEIATGWWFNSMALLADGWHMSSHTLAIGLSAFAYAAARRYAKDTRFAFGTWKIEVLAGFASAILLLGIAGIMIFSSIERIMAPQAIHYNEAIFVAVIGLIVNIVCATILGGVHSHHEHAHDHNHTHHDRHAHDLNLKSAYVHVLADAATSVLAIAALLGGLLYGWSWLDPAIGILGAVLVGIWAKNLIVETGKVLLDREMDHHVVDEIREIIETELAEGETRLTDLHVWRVGKTSYSCALSLVTHNENLTALSVRNTLAQHEEIVHTTIEINVCEAH